MTERLCMHYEENVRRMNDLLGVPRSCDMVSRDFRIGGRRARMRGRDKIDADFNLLAAAHNIARLAVLGIRSNPGGWATAAP